MTSRRLWLLAPVVAPALVSCGSTTKTATYTTIPACSGANLSEGNLTGADCSGKYLSAANLSAANLRGADFSGAKLNDARGLCPPDGKSGTVGLNC